jgi:polysaccharide deacetylase family protein (PEP-CTERM system associated)
MRHTDQEGDGDPPAGTVNALSFDVEDWSYLVMRRFGLEPVAHPPQVIRQTERLLDLLADTGARGTFFILGSTAKEVPALVRRIADAGHEVATHGYEHVDLRRWTIAEFARDLRRAVGELESIVSVPILGHRAAAFSVPPDRQQEFFDVLGDAGLKYDSSVVPISRPRYGVPGFGLGPRLVETSSGGKIVEFPLSVARCCGRAWVVAGGGYWRVLPARVIRAAIRKVNQEGRPFVSYSHNYEFDTRRLRVTSCANKPLSVRLWELKQNLGRRSIARKLRRVLREFRFVPLRDLLSEFLRVQESALVDETN